MSLSKQILLGIYTAAAVSAPAQTQTPDSVQPQELHEIVVQAPSIIHKADMDVYCPSRSAVEVSQNGLQLLNNLMIPALSVNETLGTVQAAGQSVQLRVNGRESSVEQVRALLPGTIRRVEWIDNPGLRYNGAVHVLNFIVVNPTVGGSLQAMVRPAVNQVWGFYMADAKFNTGRSQWDVGANVKLTENLRTHRDYYEVFTYPDGEYLTREEASRGGRVDNTFGSAWASYNYIKPDTTVFMAGLSMFHKFSDKFLYRGLLSLSNGDDDLLLTDSHGDRGSTPRVSLYWQQHFPDSQIFVVDFNASLYIGRSFSDYIEQRPDGRSCLTDIRTDIHDRNQAYAIEADYIKNWSGSRFTAGVSYTANRNRSRYENLGGDIFHQRQDKVYFFAEYFRRFGRWTATAGLGAQYTDFYFRESARGNHSWSARPQATITYGINSNHQFRLSFQSWQSAPSLSETNPTPQQLDGFQWRVGNPDLKTSTSYMLTLRYNFSVPNVAGSFGIRAFISPDAITPVMSWQNGRLVTSYENSRGLKNLSFFLAPQIEIIPDWLMASGYLQFRTERMSGTGYDLTGNHWSGNVAVRLMHWGFVLSGSYVRAEHNLWGERISWGENISMIDLAYNWKNWQFSGGMIMPFGKYDQGSRSLNRWNINEQHMRLDMRMPYVSVSYNFQWGHQKRGAGKLTNADASADRSTAGGR